MEDPDGKKPFIIPKTHTSNKDVLISEKPDSRNVTELFNDIKSCALEVHFDFRQNQCKSCDTIRNPKLQKLFNERRIQMKKNQDPTERFAFHLITSRDIALNIATDGLTCEQLSFSIEKYLGNPKDGIHLSRRPDVLLTSTGAQGLYKFGLLVCKILVGKGYATIPSVNNKELSAQLHYDHHFCKIQMLNKEQRHVDDLLANSLIFCYEHNDLQTLSHPSQILPLAILWYDLKEKFSSELTSTSQESQQRNGKNIKLLNSFKNTQTTKPIPKPILPLSNGTWDDLTPDPTPILPTPTPPTPIPPSPPTYPSQFMIPYSSLYTSFSNPQPSTIYRDPRLTRTVSSSETIPLSPQNSLVEKSLSSKVIPLNSTSQLIDPRLQTLKQTQNIFYLETNAVKHALQQQKRLNNYQDTKNSSISKKTNYTLIPFLIRSISSDEYERNNQISKNSSRTDYSSLYISVIDCFRFGFEKSDNQLYIDLEQNENQLAYEQIKISSQLIQQEQQLNSQEIRLHLREKSQRKNEEQINQRKTYSSSNSKIYINNGRKLLKEHQVGASANNQISLELLDFFSYEYRHETRPHVKRILAELLGVFVEKYGLKYKQTLLNERINKDVPRINNQTINTVIDMELESPFSQVLGDHDERFPVQTPSITESIYNQPFTEILSNKLPDKPNNTDAQPIQIELPLSEPTLFTDDVTLSKYIEQIDSSSDENTKIDDHHSSTLNDDSKQIVIPDSSIEIENDSNCSRDEFVQLLTKEAYITEPSSPPKVFDHSRRSYDNDESNTNQKLSSTRTVTLISNSHEDNLIIETPATNIDQQNEEEENEEPTVKRIKVDLISPSNDDINSFDALTDDHDYRHDLDERRRQADINTKPPRSRSKSTSSHNSSIKESPSSSSSSRTSSTKNHYRQQRQSCDRSYRYQQRNRTDSISSYSQPPRHQRFNYNHQSVAEHPRFANIDSVPSPVKDYNWNSFGTSNYSQAMRDYHNTSPMTNTNRNHHSSYYNEIPSNHQYYEDNYNNEPPRLRPLMSTTPSMNFTNSCDLKPSNTIERLQMFLQNKTTTPYERRQSSINDYPSSSYTMNSCENSNDPQWSSSRYSSRVESDTNNQTFTYNDAEQLLTYVQHLRN